MKKKKPERDKPERDQNLMAIDAVAHTARRDARLTSRPYPRLMPMPAA